VVFSHCSQFGDGGDEAWLPCEWKWLHDDDLESALIGLGEDSVYEASNDLGLDSLWFEDLQGFSDLGVDLILESHDHLDNLGIWLLHLSKSASDALSCWSWSWLWLLSLDWFWLWLWSLSKNWLWSWSWLGLLLWLWSKTDDAACNTSTGVSTSQRASISTSSEIILIGMEDKSSSDN